MDLIQVYVDSLVEDVKKQILVTTKFVEVTQENTDEIGFDWLLGGFNMPGSNSAFASGGTTGNSARPTTRSFHLGRMSQSGRAALTNGLRCGSAAIQTNAIDGLLSAAGAATGIAGVTNGVFADRRCVHRPAVPSRSTRP